MNTTKRSLLTSLVACFVLLSMLMGTTFAWFTDIVSSENNVIQSGSLKAEMYWSDKLLDANSDEWIDASAGAVFNHSNWEPGYTQVRYVKVVNGGSLKFKWQLSLAANGKVTELSDVIDVYYVNPVSATLTSLDGLASVGTLTDVLAGNTAEAGSLDPQGYQILAIAFHMDEYAGNEYKNMSLCEAGFSLKLLATQATGEFDSFGDDYDSNAFADIFAGFQGGSAGAAVATDDQGATTSAVSMSGGDVSAEVPAGVKVNDGVKSLQLVVSAIDASGANIQLGATEVMQSLDVHMEGVAEGNTVPMLITLREYLPTGLNSGALRLYHVEDGNTVVMTQVANPTNHNEFSYDPSTGSVTLAMASFSEVAVAVDTNNPWDGETLNYLWYDANATELTIYNADQLAGFAAIVDGKVEAEGIVQDSFAGKTVKLANNIYLSGKLFEPIGWGYENKGWNVNDRDGKPFKGTFDGGQYDETGKLVGRYTIFDLYQSGWDLINEGTGEAYTYTNCGFGLFAAASNATFKNLNISGAYVRVECVEAGVLVGLSQNSCIYENIKILDSKIANYQRPAGGLIGEVSGEGTTTITNVTIGDDVVVGSLWGDFDAPVGGVIGAYWNDVDKNPQIYMTNIDVGCRLDVYNDITSAYQWHAYRRAGMLIGNTDMSDPDNAHKAYAPFLHCSDVRVYYGDWVNYTYCSFSNHNERYPWVRTQAGENCTAFSNPRWGVPNDAEGNRVTDMNHVHAEGDECNVLRQFSQLYGGGQGVYGQDKHDGVTYPTASYSITYVNDNKVLDIIYVTDNSKTVAVANDQAKKLVGEWASANITGSWEFGGWMNAGSTKVTEIPAYNTKNIVLYPYFNKPYTARFVDLQGNVVAWCLFHAEDLTKLEATRKAAEDELPDPGELFKLDYWEVNANGNKVQYIENNFKNYTYDVTIYPVYKYTGNLKLTPVDEDSDGTIDYYKVEAIDTLDKTTIIPGYVNGVPVKLVEKLYENDNSWDYGSGVETVIIQEGVQELARNSLGYTQDLSLVKLPSTLTKLGKNTFSRNLWYNVFGDKDTKVLTIEYNGTKADWDKVVANSDGEWANGLKTGTTVKCLDGTYTVTSVNYETSNHKWSWTPN